MGCVLVVDQNENANRLAVLFLRSRGQQAFGAYSVSEAIQCVRDVVVNLMVLDQLTSMKAEARVTQALASLAQSQGITLLILHPKSSVTGASSDAYLFAIQAMDHLSKPFELEKLGQQVEALLARRVPATTASSQRLLTHGPLRLDLQNFEFKVGDKQVSLTPTEFDLLRYLMEHAGQVTSTQKLLEAVWNYPAGMGSPEAVRWHIKNLRDKLAQAGCPVPTIRTIPGRGYVIPEWVEGSLLIG